MTTHPPQLKIPATYMRGGTSKGVFFLADDLPSDPAARDRILMRVIGGAFAAIAKEIKAKHLGFFYARLPSLQGALLLDVAERMPRRIGEKIAGLVGAGAGEVVATDSTSINLFKVLSAALSIVAATPLNFIGNKMWSFARPASRFTEFTIARPGIASSAVLMTSGSVESTWIGAGWVSETRFTTSRICASSSWRSVSATQTSRTCAPPST